MNRVVFLVDGFNVYHSLRQAQKALPGQTTRWLNLRSLLASYLPAIGSDAQLESIVYFSAYATFRLANDKDVVNRHRAYIECLQSTGIRIELGRFKDKQVWCSNCRQTTIHHEEKETDVAIAVRVLELLHRDACDSIALVTGDTDIAPAVRAAQQLHPSKQVFFLFPYLRHNAELAALVLRSFQIKKERYVQHQFTDPYVLPTGRSIPKPRGW